MIEIVRNIAFFIIAISVLVAFHEFGHFWVARKCGVIVQRFSIGFGKVLWRKVGADGTEYVIGAIPLGGYVKMLDERVERVSSDKVHGAFNRQPVLARIAIVAAGPIANFIFAIIALWLMYIIGVKAIKPVVDKVEPHSVASQLNIQPGDHIVAIDGRDVQHWQDVNHAIINLIGRDSSTIAYAGSELETAQIGDVDLSNWDFDPQRHSSLASFGLVPFIPKASLTIALISKSSPAEAAGLQKGDVLRYANNIEITTWQQFEKLIQQSHGTSITLVYQRNGKELTTSLFPKLKIVKDGTRKGFAGIAPTVESWPDTHVISLQYGFFSAMEQGIAQTWHLTKLSLNMIGKLLTGDLSVKNLSGPISIAQGAGQSASYGFVAFLSFMALISINLGIFNLLPLPVLDGGHLMYYFIELLTGKPVSEKIQDVGFRIGAALLLMLMSIAIFNDFTRL